MNQATAEGTAPNGTVVSDDSGSTVTTDDTTITTLCQDASIALIKVGAVNDVNGDGCANDKETITYTFRVENTGNVALSNIIIQDPLVNVQGGPISLAAGGVDNTSFTAEYVITQIDIDRGYVENQATVQGETPQGQVVSDLSDDNSILQNDITVTDLCQGPDIALIKTGTPTDENGDGCIDEGETIIYDFVVVNTGNVVLTNITIDDPLVAVTGGPITLAAGDSDTVTFMATYTVTQANVDDGFVSNQATVFGTAPDGAVVSDLSDDDNILDNDPTVLGACQNPQISLEKTGVFNDENGDGVPQVGETIGYAFKVINIGSVTVFNITVDDPLPGIIIDGDPIPSLGVGEEDDTTFTAVYVLTQADIDAKEVVNQAKVTAVDASGNTVEDESDDPLNFDNVDPDGDGEPDDPTVTVLPDVLGEEDEFEIFNGVTPNGDGAHDFFQVLGIENYPNNNMKIFNRWGVLIYETDGYDDGTNVFRGISEGRSTVRQGEELPTGTYYYVLTFPAENPGKSSYAGYLYINR